MKKNIIESIILTSLLGLLIGCNAKVDNPSEEKPIHEHTFVNAYSKDENNHWKVATCEHTNLTSNLGNHSYGNDNICDICGYEKEISEPVIEYINVSFVDTLNNKTSNVKVAKGEKLTPIDDLEYGNFNFNGWQDEEGTLFGKKSNAIWSTYEVNEDCVFYSCYSKKSVNISISCNEYLGEFDTNLDEDDYINSYTGIVEVGTSVKIKAKNFANSSDFVAWKNNNELFSNAMFYSFVVGNNDYDIVLDLTAKEYSLEITEVNTSVTHKDKYKVGETVTLSAESTLLGTSFAGYFDEDNILVSSNANYSFVMPGYDIKLTAKSLGGKHKITKHLIERKDQVDIGIKDEIVYAFAGDEIVIDAPILKGYAGESSGYATIMPEKDIEVTFYYSPREYSITYCNIYGGQYTGTNLNSLPKTFKYSDNVNLEMPKVQSGYVYADFWWYEEPDCSGQGILFIPSRTIDHNLVLYAKTMHRDPQTALVKYVDDLGNEIHEPYNLGVNPYNALLTDYPIYEIPGYTLINNAMGSRMGEKDTTIYVTYDRPSYKLNFSIVSMNKDLCFDENYILEMDGFNNPTLTYKPGSSFALIPPPISSTDFRYKVVGMYSDQQCQNQITNVDPTWTGDKTIYCKVANVTITFKDYEYKDGQFVDKTLFVEQNSIITLSDLSQEGYIFLGYYTDSEDLSSKINSQLYVVGTEDATIYCRWLTSLDS